MTSVAAGVKHNILSIQAMSTLEAYKPLTEILETLATEGGITELGLNIFNNKAGFEVWHVALDAVHKRLLGNE